MSIYSRRVSFNNLNPEFTEPASPNRPDEIDINFGYGTSIANDLSKVFSNSSPPNYTFSQLGHSPLNKKVKKNPSKSILKNRLNYKQLQDNLNSETINYHEVETDESDDETANLNNNFKNLADEGTGRRKSYSAMTDEELMALDPQFKVPRTSNIDEFKFDNQKTYYLKDKKNYNVLNNTGKNRLNPSHNYKSINLTIQNKKYNSVHERTVLSIFNGRKHTWNSIDWLITSNFLQNNDYIIITSLIPREFENELNYKQVLYKKCENIMNWLLSRDSLGKLNLKITVEFVIDDTNSTKTFVRNLFLQYNPNILVFGSKRHNLNFKYPVKMASEKPGSKEKVRRNFIVKLPSYLIKYSPVPTIIVNPPVLDLDRSSDSSIDSDILEGVAKPKPEINYRNPNTFKNLISDVSYRSLQDSAAYLDTLDPSEYDGFNAVKFNETTKFDSKMHSIYSSQRRDSAKSNEGMYKVKSLIENPESKKNSISSSSSNLNLGKVPSTGGLTTKMIKSSLKKEAPKPEKKKSFWKKVFT